MCTELQCGICYRTYNTGHRCPRELSCGHTFCQRCLVTLARTCASPAGEDERLRGSEGEAADIVCPLCRCSTSVSASTEVRRCLPVDEAVLERMQAAGLLDGSAGDSEEEDEESEGKCDGPSDGSSCVPAREEEEEEEEEAAGSRKGKLWRAIKRFWKKCGGGSSNARRSSVIQCNSEDLRDIALMTCYMM
ncbi:RN223 protein, partial [Amia calva]|nr:RN223 protein [Amia calva]